MFSSTKIIELGSCAFRQPQATSHCRFLHGYRLVAKFWFEADKLDENNWVVDFGGLKELKKTLQHQFDHTTCITRTDPKLDEFKRLRDAGVCDLRVMDGVGIEKFAEWCWSTANKFVHDVTSGRCRCVKVELFEHENNSAIFTKNDLFARSTTNEPVVETVVKKPPVVKSPPVKKQPEPSTFKPKQTKQTNTWIDPDAPKNSWRF